MKTMKRLYIVEFDLKTRSPITVKNGDVILDKGCSTVTVRNVEADSQDNAIDKARTEADAFLNELSWQYEIGLEIGNGLTVMIQDSPLTRHIKKYHIKVDVDIIGGRRKKVLHTLQEVAIKPSDAEAHYRKAAISQDPFDKFRNLCLVIDFIQT